jgi:hypothetical protein
MWAGIVTFLKALPAIVAIVNQFRKMYNDWQDAKIHKHYEKKKNARDRIVSELEVEGKKPIEEISDEKIRELHRKLRNLDSGKL